jgi:hypothetical protein
MNQKVMLHVHSIVTEQDKFLMSFLSLSNYSLERKQLLCKLLSTWSLHMVTSDSEHSSLINYLPNYLKNSSIAISLQAKFKDYLPENT